MEGNNMNPRDNQSRKDIPLINKSTAVRTDKIVPSRMVKGKTLTARRRVRLVTMRKKNKSPFPLGVVLSAVLMTVVALFMMMNYAEIDRYNSDIADMKSQLTDLQNEATKLEQRLDRKNNLVYIEDYATEKLGMVKSNELTRINITLIDKDEGEIVKYNDGNEGGMGILLSGFGEVIRNFFD